MRGTFPEGTWTPVSAHASSRRYYKGIWKGAPALLADFGEDLESRERFLAVAELLKRQGLVVPPVLAAPEEAPWLIEAFIEGRMASRVRWTRELEAEALQVAAAFGALDLSPWPPDLVLHTLDASRLRFELAFFDLHFLQGLLNLPADEARGLALESLAEEVSAFPTVPAHRDLHSENLILHGRTGLVVVDFQDLLLAPRCYDAASLAVDAYRRVPDGFFARCRRSCEERFGCSAEEFAKTALQRALKALGTFGYQVTRRKQARYLRAARQCIPRAASLVREGPRELGQLEEIFEGAFTWL